MNLDRLQTIDEAISQLPGLALAGNGYRGVGIPDCIASGERAAEQVLAAIPASEAVEIAGSAPQSAG